MRMGVRPHACLHTIRICTCSARSGQKGASDPLELELQAVVSYWMGVGNRVRIPPARAARPLNLGSIFLALLLFSFWGTGSPVSLAVLKLSSQPRLTLNLRSSCFYLLSAGMKSVCHHPRLPSHLHPRCLRGQGKLNSLSLELACNARKPDWSIRDPGPQRVVMLFIAIDF